MHKPQVVLLDSEVQAILSPCSDWSHFPSPVLVECLRKMIDQQSSPCCLGQGGRPPAGYRSRGEV